MVSGLGCLEVAALFSSHPDHTHIPSEPLLPSPQHTCVCVCAHMHPNTWCACTHTSAHTHTKPTHALAATPVAPGLQLGELNLSGTQAFSPILANLGQDGEIGIGIAWNQGVMDTVSGQLRLHTALPTPHTHSTVS